MLIVNSIIILLCITILNRNMGTFNRLSPSLVYVYANLIFIIIGFFFYKSEYTEFTLGASFNTYLSSGHLYLTLSVLLNYLMFICLGVMIRWFIFKQHYKIMISELRLTSLSRVVKIKPSYFLITLTFVPVLFFIIGNGSNLIYSKNYLSSNYRVFSSLGNITVLPIGVIVGYFLSILPHRSFKKIILLFVSFITITILFSKASRSLAVYPIFFWFGYSYLPSGKIRPISFSIISLISLFLLAIPLYLRANYEHGLIPYALAISKLSFNDVLYSLPIYLNNVLAGFPLTYKVIAVSKEYPIDYYLTSINPLPGVLTNWYNISKELRLNKFTPFNTIGELYLYGNFIMIVTSFMIGYFLAIIDKIYFKLKVNNIFLYIIFLGAPIIMVLNSYQYNLRSYFRFIYYILALILVINFYLKISKTGKIKNEKKYTPPTVDRY